MLQMRTTINGTPAAESGSATACECGGSVKCDEFRADGWYVSAADVSPIPRPVILLLVLPLPLPPGCGMREPMLAAPVDVSFSSTSDMTPI